MVNSQSPSLLGVSNRKKHYIHNDHLNWDQQSSSDDYRKHCQPLKVSSSQSSRRAGASGSGRGFRAPPCVPAAVHAEEQRGGAAAPRPGRLYAGVRRLQEDHLGGGAVAPVLQPPEDAAEAAAQLTHTLTHTLTTAKSVEVVFEPSCFHHSHLLVSGHFKIFAM